MQCKQRQLNTECWADVISMAYTKVQLCAGHFYHTLYQRLLACVCVALCSCTTCSRITEPVRIVRWCIFQRIIWVKHWKSLLLIVCIVWRVVGDCAHEAVNIICCRTCKRIAAERQCHQSQLQWCPCWKRGGNVFHRASVGVNIPCRSQWRLWELCSRAQQEQPVRALGCLCVIWFQRP